MAVEEIVARWCCWMHWWCCMSCRLSWRGESCCWSRIALVLLDALALLRVALALLLSLVVLPVVLLSVVVITPMRMYW